MSALGLVGMCFGLAGAGLGIASARQARRTTARAERRVLAEEERYRALSAQLRARSRWLNGVPVLGLHWPPDADFLCPACHRVSANPFDLVSGWCAACKEFTGDPLVDWQTAANVLTHFDGVQHGFWCPAGDYSQALIDAACRADHRNLSRLLAAKPELITAVWLYKEIPGGPEFLINLCRRYRERAGRRTADPDTPRPPAVPESIGEILARREPT